jgi:hypothetical protein
MPKLNATVQGVTIHEASEPWSKNSVGVGIAEVCHEIPQRRKLVSIGVASCHASFRQST